MTQNKISEFFTLETPKEQVKTYPFTIEENFHTKKEIPIWVLKLDKAHRLTRESFNKLKQDIKQLNAYYSHYSKGFIFENKPEEEILNKTNDLITNLDISESQKAQTLEVNYRPLSDETTQRYNFYRMFKSEDLNNNYEARVKHWEAEIKELLNLDLNQLPPLISEAFEYYLKALREFYERIASANIIFPNPFMTGRSGYKNIDRKRKRSQRTEKIGIEKLEKAEKRLEARIKAYKKQLIINTPIEINFTKENLNKEIAEIRKKYKVHKMTISKVFGGVRSKRKHATYYIDLKEKTYQMEIDEFGTFGFSLYNSYPLAITKKLNSVKEMVTALDTILTGIIDDILKFE